MKGNKMKEYLLELAYVDDFQDKIEVITFIIGIITLLVATIGLGFTVYSIREASRRATRERDAALQQAKRDLQWRQTVEAQSAIRRLLDDGRASNAMTMLDWDGERFPIGERPSPIKRSDVIDALRVRVSGELPDQQLFIREAFDALFTNLELIQQSIKADIFGLADIEFPISYYVKKMKDADIDTFKMYMTHYEFTKAQTLIDDISRRLDPNSSPPR
jgi:hypothetical protein